MRFIKFNKCLSIIVLVTVTTLLIGCDMAILDPKGEIGLAQKNLIFTALGLMLIIVIPVIIMTIVFIYKFRSSNQNAIYTPNWSHSNKIEAIIWIVPIIIISILATLTWKTTHQLDPYKPLFSNIDPIQIDVISLDWKWLFIYPDLGIATINELAFPINHPITFHITSNSVMNSFFIPRLGGQIYAMAGMQTQLHLIANKPGKYNGISSSYSGRGFSGMKFTTIATPDNASFQQWVSKVNNRAHHQIATMAEFEILAKPSEYHPVEYFSNVKPDLFIHIINKFMGNKKKCIEKNEHIYMSQNSSAYTRTNKCLEN
ncbi:Cytochrome bo(3) ubiquinol oxidase subunit 2 [Candidatus Profftia lariciata]|uniref:ubiquinol oxidase subunit II n=1 Tax=Candidatus Profftia lariciata TaxID=1987921 RepID=UPI001D009F8D|nr:ubiquinol oxidase subunit II [Candidatus Profftia lariciata]UDG81732.1 Cytochrome bo(3) ubiquinol oxidase subunit 2 [Candidatus Profftia lariciata]